MPTLLGVEIFSDAITTKLHIAKNVVILVEVSFSSLEATGYTATLNLNQFAYF